MCQLAVIALRLPGNVQLRIISHAAVVHVGRADAEETIVDQQALGVYVGRQLGAVGGHRRWIINAEMMTVIPGSLL